MPRLVDYTGVPRRQTNPPRQSLCELEPGLDVVSEPEELE